MKILDKFASFKEKYIRANHSKFVTKELTKAIMLRSKVRNQLLKTKTQDSKMKHNKQRILCVSIRRNYYENLDLKNITDSMKLGLQEGPFLSTR